jgi:polar amino acid transport system substrate-binding protein
MTFQFACTPERMQEYQLVGPIRCGFTVFMTSRKTTLDDWAELSRDIRAQTPRQRVSMLLAGRINVIVVDRVQLMYFVREQHAEQDVRILDKLLVEMPCYVVFAKGDSVRADQFAAALEGLRQAGTLDTLYQRWH